MYFKLHALALLGMLAGIGAYYEWEWATVLLLMPATVAALVSLTGRA